MSTHPHASLDLEIASAEIRIQYHRLRLHAHKTLLSAAVRAKVASPGMLLAATGVGYIVGSLTQSSRPHQPSPAGRLFAVITDALRVVLKFSRSGPAVWLATTIGASRAASKSASPPEPYAVDRVADNISVESPVTPIA
ncbi:MAG: hypothetical protein ABI612_00445 [Betaproteobacteria bacterium]